MKTPHNDGPPSPKAASKLRFQALNAFVDCGILDAQLSPSTALVWLVLFRFASAENNTVKISTDRIAECTGLNRKTVTRGLSALKKAKMVRVLEPGGINRGASKYLIRSCPPQQNKGP